ncbi:uncharacterized protein I303_102573 [Kwoniella dejecticola CBS 10117]|uniref:F-box domain-containing protein n=1 Tax=Kwoniella dejecticola CBS 10117 TaxID=1296121 RepID=A0A1A6A945_9TREE|nr:uncharacterized protein I303_02587 [Kwoniella dejecticola CBS 10117]OBR86579.1 hypothetical protein I303_02587 [Kwoniella dejecticola CBS 10117]
MSTPTTPSDQSHYILYAAFTSSNEHRLPPEIVCHVLSYLELDRQLRALANIAQCCKSLLAAAFPYLYTTFIITAKSNDTIFPTFIAHFRPEEDDASCTPASEHPTFTPMSLTSTPTSTSTSTAEAQRLIKILGITKSLIFKPFDPQEFPESMKLLTKLTSILSDQSDTLFPSCRYLQLHLPHWKKCDQFPDLLKFVSHATAPSTICVKSQKLDCGCSALADYLTGCWTKNPNLREIIFHEVQHCCLLPDARPRIQIRISFRDHKCNYDPHRSYGHLKKENKRCPPDCDNDWAEVIVRHLQSYPAAEVTTEDYPIAQQSRQLSRPFSTR